MSIVSSKSTAGASQRSSVVSRDRLDRWISAAGNQSIRYGLVVVLLWIGGMKFTSYEAEAISGFVNNSPLMSWTYSVFSSRAVSALIGVAEIAIALLIFARPFSATAAVVGAALACGMFFTTLSFMVSTPGIWEAAAGGVPAISVTPGQFLVKDFVLLGASIWIFAEAYKGLSHK